MHSGGLPTADPDRAAGIIYHIWPGNASGAPQGTPEALLQMQTSGKPRRQGDTTPGTVMDGCKAPSTHRHVRDGTIRLTVVCVSDTQWGTSQHFVTPALIRLTEHRASVPLAPAPSTPARAGKPAAQSHRQGGEKPGEGGRGRIWGEPQGFLLVFARLERRISMSRLSTGTVMLCW